MNVFADLNVSFEYAGLFTSENEWIHPDRTECTYEIIYVTDGVVYMNDEKYGDIVLQKGMVCLFEPGVRHFGSRRSSHVSFYWVHFHAEPEVLPFSKRIFNKTVSPYLFRELLHYAFLPEKPDYLTNSILVHILSEMRYLSENTAENKNQLAEKIYEWVRVNADATLRSEKIASHFGFSSDHITRIIKKHYGTGIKTLVDIFTLSKAKELLVNTEKYVKEISAELGFPDDKAFIGFFKYHEGIYPSEFRNRFYKIHMNRE